MLQSSEMLPYLQQEDIAQMRQYFDSIPGGQATYSEFYPLAKEIILRVYRVKDPSEVQLLCQLWMEDKTPILFMCYSQSGVN